MPSKQEPTEPSGPFGPRGAVHGAAHTDEHATHPLVSVIIPVRNDAGGVRSCVEVLQRQSYSEDRIEILVVDNGSTDDTWEVISELGVRALRETSARNSYAARNRGLVESTGEIIAFTDADCVPHERWVHAGVRALLEQGADLAGGRVRFDLGPRATGAEIWDSVTNMQMADSIRTRGVAKTANLFVRREVVDAIGAFPTAAPSGGDVAWTARATAAGFRLVYAADAEVRHPARRLGALVRKQIRVGVGQASLLGAGAGTRQALSLLMPLRPSDLRARLRDRGEEAASANTVRVWTAASICRAATAAGILWGLPRLRSRETGG